MNDRFVARDKATGLFWQVLPNGHRPDSARLTPEVQEARVFDRYDLGHAQAALGGGVRPYTLIPASIHADG